MWDDQKVLETKDERDADRMTDETSRLPKRRLQPNLQVFCCDDSVSFDDGLAVLDGDGI